MFKNSISDGAKEAFSNFLVALVAFNITFISVIFLFIISHHAYENLMPKDTKATINCQKK